MIVAIVGHVCYVYREDGDLAFRPNRSRSSWSGPGWYGAESRLLHHVRLVLDRRGYGLVKERMWRDGHMVGTEHTQYLRSRDSGGMPSLCVYHADHAVEIAAELFNEVGRVELAVEYGLTEEGDGPATAASREHVRAIEARHPCYEVSWDTPAELQSGVMTSGEGRYRHYKGFTDRTQAVAWLRSCPGEYARLIDRRTGECLTD